MADAWSFPQVQLWDGYGQDTSNSYGAVVTANASANTKGSWVQLGASTLARNAKWLSVGLRQNNSVSNALVDIGIGTAGNEKVLISNMMLYGPGGNTFFQRFFFPVEIPAGTQLNARSQASTGGHVSIVVLHAGYSGFTPCQYGTIIDTYGALTASSLGTAVAGNASANTKGSYAQITSATTRNHKALVLSFGVVTGSNGDKGQQWDFAIGGAGSEKIIAADVQVGGNSDWYAPSTLLIPCSIPAGTRLSARVQSTRTSETCKAVIYGIS